MDGVYRPDYKIIAGTKDITENLRGRLIELSISDVRGLDSDALELSLDDTDKRIIWPRRGQTLQVWIGYRGEALHYHGKFTVDEATHSGPPDKVTIRAKAPDLLSGIKASKTRPFHETTLGAIAQQIASDNKLELAISDKLASTPIKHLDQNNESDLNLLTRIGKMYGAVAKVADGRLVLVQEGKTVSASGKSLPRTTITRSQVASHHYVEAGRQEYVAVEALSYDYNKAKLTKVTYSKAGASVTDQDVYPVGKNSLKRLKQTLPDEESAKRAAEAEWRRLGRGSGTLELDAKHGLPALHAETRVAVSGFRQWIDGDWVAVDVTHTLSATGGLSTRIKCERHDDYLAANQD